MNNSTPPDTLMPRDELREVTGCWDTSPQGSQVRIAGQCVLIPERGGIPLLSLCGVSAWAVPRELCSRGLTDASPVVYKCANALHANRE
ncbi:hypothetical protein CEXT_464001 [Caerostris extrusa]|uniref:Uncharacterized protein n=1 Tax=Caerostris extrusa TaxID=172846 RepID=A0AAV4M8M8_CAEEX|nr:hypothetical protein CEXT_464001 [Caerostris extrusa]